MFTIRWSSTEVHVIKSNTPETNNVIPNSNKNAVLDYFEFVFTEFLFLKKEIIESFIKHFK